MTFNRDLLHQKRTSFGTKSNSTTYRQLSNEHVFTSLAPQNDFSMRPLLHLLLSFVDTWHSQQPLLNQAPGRATCLLSSQA